LIKCDLSLDFAIQNLPEESDDSHHIAAVRRQAKRGHSSHAQPVNIAYEIAVTER